MSVQSLNDLFATNGTADMFINILLHRMHMSSNDVSKIIISLVAAGFANEYKDSALEGDVPGVIADQLQDFLAANDLVDPDKLGEAADRLGGMVVTLVQLRRAALLSQLAGTSGATETATQPASAGAEVAASSADPVPPASDAATPS